MRKISILLLALPLMFSCADSNSQYVRQAIRIMDKQGLFAEGPDWEAARTAALSAKPVSLEDAQDRVRAAAKVAGGKHSSFSPRGVWFPMQLQHGLPQR